MHYFLADRQKYGEKNKSGQPLKQSARMKSGIIIMLFKDQAHSSVIQLTLKLSVTPRSIRNILIQAENL